MKFRPTPLVGAHTIEIERRGDDRGFFARVFCSNEFSRAGLVKDFVQINNSLSSKKGTLRGLHFQLPNSAEVKVVRCVKGALWDAIVDLRPDSPTFAQWFGVELNEQNRVMMYVPRGFAHAILTLTDDTEAFYLVSDFYAPDRERGLRWNDPHFNIKWPIEPRDISPKDASWPNFDPAFHEIEQFRGI
jgi:dTDP-4-dehydrorhamnose 3,5-epimerase